MSYQPPLIRAGQVAPAAPAPLPRTRLVLVVACAGALGACGLMLLALTFIGADVPRGTRSAGVDIGGMTRAGAADRLNSQLGSKLTAPLNARVQGTSFTIDPAASGVRLDTSATADAAATRNPFLRGAALLGRREVRPVIGVDVRKLAPALDVQTARHFQPLVPGSIRFDGTTPVAVHPQPGRGLDRARSAAAIKADWLRHDPVVLTVSTLTPEATAAQVDQALEEIARPAVAAPVTVQVANRTAVIAPLVIAQSITISAVDGTITPRFDPKRLSTALAGVLRPVSIAPRDASFKIVGTGVQIVPSAAGREVDVSALAKDLAGVIIQPAPRVVTGELIDNVEPKLTTARAAALGVKERISTFTTHHPCCASRVKNIHLIADRVDGALVMPGATFSLNGFTGPRTRAQGYTEAPVISGGKLKTEVGGGVSQFATTTFNAVFFGGLKDVEHKPHSFYISRYPPGREATIYAPSVDLKFTNDSPYAVLIDTSYTATSVTVSFWSTKRYDIESITGPRTNPRSPVKVYAGAKPGCISTSGVSGFDITVTRVFKQAGREIRREQFHTTYQAENEVICSEPPGTPPPPPPDD